MYQDHEKNNISNRSDVHINYLTTATDSTPVAGVGFVEWAGRPCIRRCVDRGTSIKAVQRSIVVQRIGGLSLRPFNFPSHLPL